MSAMQRRQTLGPVSGAALNTRSAVGRASLGGSLKPSAANKFRQSMGPGAEQQPRRSSTMGRKSSAAGVRGAADPRPLGDKAFMHEALNKLADYLSLNNYDHKLDIGKSWKPTGKEFQALACFLIKQLDTKWQCGAKFEDEFIVTLKSLGYPYTISKTSLSAVGSPHAWPQILGSIDWLVDLLTYDAEVEASGGQKMGEFETGTDIAREGDERFNNYLFESYVAFLAARDDEYEDYKKEFIDFFDEQTDNVTQVLAEKENTQNQLKKAIDIELQTGAKLPIMRSTLSSNENDVEKLTIYVEKLIEHNENFGNKIKGKKEEIRIEQEKVNQVKESCKNLKSKINAQELSADEALRMVSEKERIERQLNETAAYHQSMKHKEWEAETELNRNYEELERVVHSYTAKASQMQLLPLGAKNAQNVDFRIEINKEMIRTASSDRDVLCCEVSDNIIPSLSKFKTLLNDKLLGLRNSSGLLLDKEEQAQEILDEVKEKLENFQTRFVKLEEKLARQKEAHDAILQEKALEHETMEAQIEQLKDDPVERERRKTKISRRLAELQNVLDVQRETHALENDRTQRKLTMAISHLTNYQVHVTRTLKDLSDMVESKHMNVEAAALN